MAKLFTLNDTKHKQKAETPQAMMISESHYPTLFIRHRLTPFSISLESTAHKGPTQDHRLNESKSNQEHAYGLMKKKQQRNWVKANIISE